MVRKIFEPRRYRESFAGRNLVYFNCTFKETDIQIGATVPLKDEACAIIRRVRENLEEYARLEPEFLHSLKPLVPKEFAPLLVKAMHQAACFAGVGPMAAVAGAISEAVGRGLLKYSNEMIVENGGDIFISTNAPRVIGIYAGASPLSGKIGIEVEPKQTPLGICTSSGTFGHSFSFGKCDAAVILARDAALSDAVATAAANLVKTESDVEKALEFVSQISGVIGAVIIKNEKIGLWGEVKLAKVQTAYDLP